MSLKQRIKDSFVNLLADCITPRVRDLLCDEPYFRIWEKKGLHITPVHYYQPIPDTRELMAHDWMGLSSMHGIDMNAFGQLKAIDEFSVSYKNEYSAFPLERTPDSEGFFVNNGTFESVDCEAAYCFVRRFKPTRILEIGGGNSTMLLSMAAKINRKETGIETRLTIVEPFPGPKLKADLPDFAELIEKKAEALPPDVLSDLSENDILFIDSSHVLKTANDVNRLYLDILPTLNIGVMVHVHDIFLPADYPREVIMERNRFWTEQYLLQAFLAFNRVFRVEWGSSFLHHFYPERLEAAFPSYSRATRKPGSLWMRKVSLAQNAEACL